MKVLLILLSLFNSKGIETKCNRCGYEKKFSMYPPYSKQLQEVIKLASEKVKIKLTSVDTTIINKIIWKENRSGNLTSIHNGCYGLGQGKKATYKSTGVPWKTTCPVEQVEMIILYVKYRYKSFQAAWNHHARRNWY